MGIPSAVTTLEDVRELLAEANAIEAARGANPYSDYLRKHRKRPNPSEAAAIGQMLGGKVRADNGTMQPPNGRVQFRDQQNGQFAYDGNWNRLCVCGHELGYHVAGGFDCLNGDRLNIGSIEGLDAHRFPNTNCRCEKFRPSRKKSP